MRLVLLLTALVATGAFAEEKSDPVGSALISCAPKTYEAALDCLDTHLPPKMQEQLAGKDGIVMAHFGLGMFLRNNWGLWKGGDLSLDLRKRGFTHPDDMSSVILEGFAARERGESYDLMAKAAKYRAYWGARSKQGNN